VPVLDYCEHAPNACRGMQKSAWSLATSGHPLAHIFIWNLHFRLPLGRVLVILPRQARVPWSWGLASPKSASVWTKPGQNVRAPGGAVRDDERGLREVLRSDPDRAD